MIPFFTIGYEGLTPDQFDDLLRRHRIDLLFDIRDNPYSRKEGFTKGELARRLEGMGIRYVHLKELGCPRWLREETHKSKDYLAYFQKYGGILETRSEAVLLIAGEIASRRVCLMCMEKRYDRCHRRAVAQKLVEINPELQAVELR